MKLSIGKAFKRGWQDFKRHAVLMLIAGLLVVIVAIGSMFFSPLTIVEFYLGFGLMKLSLAAYLDNDPSINDLFPDAYETLKFIGAGIVVFPLTGIGFALFLLPGLAVLTYFQFFTLAILDERRGPIQSLRRSAALVSGNALKLFFFLALVVVCKILSWITFGLATIIVLPVLTLATVAVFFQLRQIHEGAERNKSKASKQKSGRSERSGNQEEDTEVFAARSNEKVSATPSLPPESSYKELTETLLELEGKDYADAIKKIFNEFIPATRAHILVAYENLNVILAAFEQEFEEKTGEELNIERFIRWLAEGAEKRMDDEINSRRLTWFLHAALLKRIAKRARNNDNIVEIGAKIWCTIAEDAPRLKELLPNNVVWDADEKMRFDLSGTDKELIGEVLSRTIPSVFAEHEYVEEFADSKDIVFSSDGFRFSFDASNFD